jgi:hypothetical protein
MILPLFVLFIVLISILPMPSSIYIPTNVMAQKEPSDNGGKPETGGSRGAGGA